MELHAAGWSMSASVNLPLHHKDQTFSYGASSPGWSQKKGRKTVVVVVDRIVLKSDSCKNRSFSQHTQSGAKSLRAFAPLYKLNALHCQKFANKISSLWPDAQLTSTVGYLSR